MAAIVIAMGGNLNGRWGDPNHTIARAVKTLSVAALTNVNCSAFYRTIAVGSGLQPRYCNMVLTAQTGLSPRQLLRQVKQVERRAGRRLHSHWSSRVLDIDLISYNSIVIGWPPLEIHRSGSGFGRRARGGLILPHPQAHLRAFVMKPLADVAPYWRHPAIGQSAWQILARLPDAKSVERLG